MEKIVINNDDEGADLNSPDATFKSAEQIATDEATEAARLKDEEDKVDKADADDEAKVISIDDKEYILNEEGNAINEDGSVFKTKEELDKLDEGTEESTHIEIDGTQYKLNDKGDAIDDSGKVIHSKEDIDTMGEDIPSFDIAELSKDTALEIYDSNGNVIEYENTTDDLKRYNQDVYNKGNTDGVNNLYQAYPEVSALVRHLQLGGTSDNFNVKVDYSGIKLNKDNEAQLKDIIYKAQTARGNRLDAIDKYYNALGAGDTDNDNVYEEAEVELKYLQDTDKANKVKQDKLLEDKQLQEDIYANDYWGVQVEDGKLTDLGNKDSVYGIIKSGKIQLDDKTWNIPKQIRVVEDGKPVMYTSDDFFAYLYNPITVNVNGQRITTTRDALKLQQEQVNRTVSNDIYDSFKRFVNYDDSQFITEQINTDKVKTIKKLTTKRNVKSSGAAPNRVTKTKKIVLNN